MTTRTWHTFHQNFVGDGSTPLDQNTLNLYDLPEGGRLRRTLLHVQLGCQLEASSAADQPVDYMTRVTMATALWLGDGTDPAPNCPSVLDDADTADWLLWDAMQGWTDSDALAETGVYRVLWATPAAGLDVQTRRNAVAGNANDLWLAWQVEDPFGVINNSTDTYNAYLSGWFTIRFLVETD